MGDAVIHRKQIELNSLLIKDTLTILIYYIFVFDAFVENFFSAL